MDYNTIMAQLAQYNRIAEETAAIIDGLKDELKQIMIQAGKDTLIGSEHKATYKPFTSSRIDTKAFKHDLPELAARYTTTNSTMRFTFS